MKISVIVTVYNRFEYARNILKCLINQTCTIHELIFADDGSKENLFDAVKDLIPKCNFKIKHIYQEDLGFRASKNRNNGAREAEGDILLFMDQDVIFPDNFIEKFLNDSQEGKFIFSRAINSTENEKLRIEELINLDGKYSKIYKDVDYREKIKQRKQKNNKDIFYNFLYSIKLRSRGAKIPSMIFSINKNDFIKVNGFDENFEGWGHEDDDLFNRLYKAGFASKPIFFDMPPIHMWHHHEKSKKESPNERYYRKRKEEISRKNYRCVNGYKNSSKNDNKIHLKILN
ncbi:glycosyl transferase family 2 (plasmid) [Ilyobacter polytropus DSM 2926]|uniref:Glycosyl transferase family 2 n=1 Tax=Ilyobacter polytropus (strain ATCC 51220 / DSM 2926 / LMG 16218 / CuHBu1) TaxID=572544 RepID=E3HD34_ILYPC|nr:glycosyl transferase family 2 [Ilyobacter polytropus DSM 2926]